MTRDPSNNAGNIRDRITSEICRDTPLIEERFLRPEGSFRRERGPVGCIRSPIQQQLSQQRRNRGELTGNLSTDGDLDLRRFSPSNCGQQKSKDIIGVESCCCLFEIQKIYKFSD